VIIRALPKGNGAARRIRTPGLIITSDALYQLSYCGAPGSGPWGRGAFNGAARPAQGALRVPGTASARMTSRCRQARWARSICGASVQTRKSRPNRYVGAQSLRLPDGFESLGDSGWVDEDGYLYIADRRTEMSISGGHNIYPAEIEAAQLENCVVAEAIAIGLPDAGLGARVHAIVRLEAGANATAEELLAFASERLIAYKMPRTIESTCEALRDEAGKEGKKENG
jgi:acyl-CoA synthetase (AMP-forming)/AMP-acid ligase II